MTEWLQELFPNIPVPLEILLTAAATILLLIILRLLGRVFPRFYAKLGSWAGTRIRAFRVQDIELLPADRVAVILVTFLKYLHIGLILVICYLYLSLVFSFFPATQGLADKLIGYFAYALNFVWKALVSFLPSLILIVVIGIVAYYLVKFVHFFFGQVQRGAIVLPGFHREWAQPTYKIVRLFIVALAAIMIFPYLPGSATPAFQAISIFLGFLISLGSTAVVANIVAGVVLTYMGAFELGDRVRIADTVGDVVEKTLLVTRVRTIKNVDITIPNAMVLANHIINYSAMVKESGLILHTSVTLGYDVPWRQVHELLIAGARATEQILEEPASFVLQTSLDGFYVSYELNAYTDQPNVMARIYSSLHRSIQDQLNEAGIEMLSPQYTAVRDGHHATIPEGYLPKDYEVPALRLSSLGQLLGRPGAGKKPPRDATG